MTADVTQLRDAAFKGDVATVLQLLTSGVNPNDPLPNGDLLLVSVAGMGDARLAITEMLVRYGADVNSPCGGMTLLKWIQQSTYCDNEQTIQFLQSQGACANDLPDVRRTNSEVDNNSITTRRSSGDDRIFARSEANSASQESSRTSTSVDNQGSTRRSATPRASDERNEISATDVIRFACHGCGKRLKAVLHDSGKQGKCPSCGFRLYVPKSLTSRNVAPAVGQNSQQQPKGVIVACPNSKCSRELRARKGVFGKTVQCKFCGTSFNLTEDGSVTQKPTESHWYVLRKGQRKEGPFSIKDLHNVTPMLGMRIRRDYDATWVAVQNAREQYPELANVHCALFDEKPATTPKASPTDARSDTTRHARSPDAGEGTALPIGVLVFREGEQPPLDEQQYCRDVTKLKYGRSPDHLEAAWCVGMPPGVGLNYASVFGLYARLRELGRLPDLGDIKDRFVGHGPDRQCVIAFFF